MSKAILLMGLAAFAVASGCWAADTVKNGNFEDGKVNAPAFWTVNSVPGATAAWEPSGGIRNSRCLSITFTQPDKGEGVVWEQHFKLEPYKAYMLKGYIKGDDIKLGVPDGILTPPSLASGMYPSDTAQLRKSPEATGTFGWTPFAVDFVTGPSGDGAVYLRFGSNGMVGKAYFDNISVYPNPDTEQFRSKHMILNLWKDEVAAATREGVIQVLKNTDKLYESYTELTGHHPGSEMSSAYAPRYVKMDAVGFSGNPIIWTANKDWMKKYWTQKDYCPEIFLHEFGHNFDVRGAGYDMHCSELMFYYGCVTNNFIIGEDEGPHQGKDVRYRWKLRGAAAGVPDSAYWIHRLIPFIDEVGWEPVKKTYRSYQNPPVPGLPGTTPTDRRSRWPVFKTFLDRLSFFAGKDAWAIFTKEEREQLERGFNNVPEQPTLRPDEAPADVTTAWLSDFKWDSAAVGYSRPCRNCNEMGFPLKSYERTHAKGFATHAFANLEFNLGGKWKKLDFYYALIVQSKGSVHFMVQGDGKELFHSELVKDKIERHTTIDVTGVKTLRLLVDDGGDGTGWDWGCWLSPQLTR